MVDYFDRSGIYVCGAIGPADLTAWDNAQAALLVGELIALDRIIEAHIDWCEPTQVEVNSTTPPIVLDGPPKRGKIDMTTWFQTGIQDYVVMGACTTTEATPNIHAITFTTANDPPYFAIHAEKKETNNPQRDDGMGTIITSDTIACSEQQWHAKRHTLGGFAYSGAGGELAEPTKQSLSTARPLTWADYKNSSGASEFQYNSGDIGFEITGFSLAKQWAGAMFTAIDGDGFPTVGKFIKPYTYPITLQGYRTDTGTDIADIVKLKPSAYAGDLDFIADFYESATRYHKSTYDKMRFLSESWKESYVFHGGQWIPGHTVTLLPLDNTSSLAIEEKNAINNDSYENPA